MDRKISKMFYRLKPRSPKEGYKYNSGNSNLCCQNIHLSSSNVKLLQINIADFSASFIKTSGIKKQPLQRLPINFFYVAGVHGYKCFF